jgi:hypothetical protein
MIRTVIMPESETISVTIPKKYIGKKIEIVVFENGSNHLENTLKTSLPGKPLDNKEFLNWIEHAEALPTISLQEAKSKWGNKKKQLNMK